MEKISQTLLLHLIHYLDRHPPTKDEQKYREQQLIIMERQSFLTASGLIPPFPVVDSGKSNHTEKNTDGLIEPATSDTGDKKNHPSRLLSLIRLLEKKERDDDDYEVTIEETVDLFNHLIAVYSRHGLLRGDSEKAERILSMVNSNTSRGGVGGGGAEGGRKRNGKKRGNKKNNSNNNKNNSDDLRVQQHQHGVTMCESSASQQQEDEVLIFTAILRILPLTNDMSKVNTIDDDKALLIRLATELCLSISQHIKVDKESGTCNLAEYELLAQSGKPILTGLINTIQWVEYDMKLLSSSSSSSEKRQHSEKCLTLVEWDEQTHVSTLTSSMKLACSLVSLFGTKLSRSTSLLLELNKISWKLLIMDNDSVQESAARLISCLPLAGGTDRKTPSDIWNAQLLDTLTALSTVLETMAPLTKLQNRNTTQTDSSHSSNGTMDKFLEDWINFVRRDISNESYRLRCFYRLSRGLTKVFHFLLFQDGLDRYHCSSTLVDAQVEITKILAVVESFVSFPLSSETVYYRTKRRLRDENVDNGLLSPRIIVTEVANHIKLMGHEILDCTLAAVGGPVLLPYARRILRISYASILTSSSGPVRKVIEPTSAAQLEGKKRRWLHLSIVSRALAIRTFGKAIMVFGCDSSASSLNQSQSSSSTSQSLTAASTDGEKTINLIVGCLVEQISNNKIQTDDFDNDWGTSAERIELIKTSAACLEMALSSCGGFLLTSIRSLIESVVVTALSKLSGTGLSAIQILTWAPVKVSILRLACSCVTTPWQDGASSSLVDLLAVTARKLTDDMDTEVSINARASLGICDTIAVPRAPALTYVARAVLANTNAATTEAISLAANIQTARNEAIEIRKKTEEIELAKKRKVEERRQQEQQEKAAKRQKALSEKKIEKRVEGVSDAKATNKGSLDATVVDQEMTIQPESSKEKDDEGKLAAKDSTGIQIQEEATIQHTNENDDGENMEEQITKSKMTLEEDENENDGENDGINNSDDEALPEIFDGGPDSDDDDDE